MATNLSRYRRPEPAMLEQRQAPRHRVSVTRATVRRHGRAPAEAELHDVSSYGCRLDGLSKFVAGERLWLRFEGSMPIAATVVWCRDRQLGCRFDEALASGLFKSLVLAAAA